MASACHTSTCAPARGVHALPLTVYTPSWRSRGRPANTAALVVSEVRSERLSSSSTKYGPSVSAGVTTQERVAGVAVAVGEPLAVGVAALVGVCVPAGVGVGVALTVVADGLVVAVPVG